MARLLWFHNFGRDNIADALSALRSGPAPNPSTTSRTSENERILGIARPHVYAYLGRTLEAFGKWSVALAPESLTGKMSPFDTGGLVEHIAPVNGWSQVDRRRYLSRYSWPTDDLEDLVAQYPTETSEQLRAYLNGDQPETTGPHEIWSERDGRFIASIWASGNDSRAWLWEGRSPKKLRVGANLENWSCAPAMYGEILRYTENVTDAAEIAWLESIWPRYVEGGVGALVRSLRRTQEAA